MEAASAPEMATLLRPLTVAGLLVGAVVGAEACASSRSIAGEEASLRASVHECLLGDALGSDEDGRLRLRRIQLGLEARGEEAPADWPTRCAPLAQRLSQSLAASGKVGPSSQVASLADTLQRADWRTLPLMPVDPTRELRHANLTTAKPDVPVAPRPIASAPADARSALVFDAHETSSTDVDALQTTTARLLFADRDHAAECVFTSSTGACTPLDPRKTASPRFWGSAAVGARALVGSVDGLATVHDDGHQAPTSEKVLLRVKGAYAHADGTALALTEGTPWELLHLDPGGRITRRDRLAAPSRSSQWLLADRLVRADESGDLGIQRVDGQRPSPAQTSRLPSPVARVAGCRTSDGLALVAATTTTTTDQFVRFVDAAGADWRRISFPSDASVTCSDRKLVLTRLEESRIRQLRCDATACVESSLAYSSFARRLRHFASSDGEELLRVTPGPGRPPKLWVGEVRGKMLVVWASPTGGLRMRLADPSEIAHARDVVLFDDAVFPTTHFDEGKDFMVDASQSAILDVQLVTRHDFALLVLRSMRGHHAIRVLGDGAAQTVTLEKR